MSLQRAPVKRGLKDCRVRGGVGSQEAVLSRHNRTDGHMNTEIRLARTRRVQAQAGKEILCMKGQSTHLRTTHLKSYWHLIASGTARVSFIYGCSPW